MKRLLKKSVLIPIAVLSCVLIFAAAVFVACTNSNQAGQEYRTLVVGASPIPHAEILDFIKYKLRGEGIHLEIRKYTDFIAPNADLAEGILDANFFQHIPYLASFNVENNTNLEPVKGVHFEPLGIYPGRTAALEEVSQAGQVAIPHDPSNAARALRLLQEADLIELDQDAGLFVTPEDIIANRHNLQILKVEAAQLPVIIDDVDFAVINGNYALEHGIDFDSALAVEDRESEAAERYTNYLVVRSGDVDRVDIQTLAQVLNSPELRQFIEERYGGRVVPTF